MGNIFCHIHEIITGTPFLVLQILYQFSSVFKHIINNLINEKGLYLQWFYNYSKKCV